MVCVPDCDGFGCEQCQPPTIGRGSGCLECRQLEKGICKLCLELRKEEVRARAKAKAGIDARARSKSPLVSSAERTHKCQKVEVEEMVISTPMQPGGVAESSTKLPFIPLFPKPAQVDKGGGIGN